MLNKATRTLVLFIFVSAPSGLYAQNAFSDGFEASTIDPFWAVSSGSAQLITSLAHTGNQSIQMATSGYGQTAALTHQFQSPIYGTVQVYVYNPLVVNTGYKQLWIQNGPNQQNQLNAYDMYIDWGDLNTYLYYPVGDPSTGSLTLGNTHLFPAPSSPGWHRWTITSVQSGVTIQIDGTTVFTNPVPFRFDKVQLSECCIAGTATFDDFIFDPGVVVPDAPMWVVFILGVLLVYLAARHLRARTA